MIKAEIVADSLNEYGQRLTSFVCVFPRIVLAEFNTHRALSRNSSSSRAIPFEKMVKMVEDNPFIPIKWMKDHKGMQGTEYFSGYDEIDIHDHWLEARDWAVDKAKALSSRGLTKQICNRLLEPFMWHTVLVTATEWENFFALRAHEAAEIHIQDLAYKMLDEYNKSTPKQLKAGEWHIPFGDTFDKNRLFDLADNLAGGCDTIPEEYEEELNSSLPDLMVKIATARCARVSYLNFEGKDDYEADIKLHDMLLSSGHMSPFEHCARAMNGHEIKRYTISNPIYDNELEECDRGYNDVRYTHEGWCGNFRGFIQYRKTIAGENKIDKRVKKK